jgi:hypothetical protein
MEGTCLIGGRLVRILGSKSGFKTARDLILFVVGLGICIWHIATTDPAHLSWQLLIFGGGMAGLPTAFRQDEKRVGK